MIFCDTNVLIDILAHDATWFDWSRGALARYREDGLVINHIVVAELANYVAEPLAMADVLGQLGLGVLSLDMPAALRSGKAFCDYRRRGGDRASILADFLIAGHAAALEAKLLTRDKRKIATYFPELILITPETEHG